MTAWGDQKGSTEGDRVDLRCRRQTNKDLCHSIFSQDGWPEPGLLQHYRDQTQLMWLKLYHEWAEWQERIDPHQRKHKRIPWDFTSETPHPDRGETCFSMLKTHFGCKRQGFKRKRKVSSLLRLRLTEPTLALPDWMTSFSLAWWMYRSEILKGQGFLSLKKRKPSLHDELL